MIGITLKAIEAIIFESDGEGERVRDIYGRKVRIIDDI